MYVCVYMCMCICTHPYVVWEFGLMISWGVLKIQWLGVGQGRAWELWIGGHSEAKGLEVSMHKQLILLKKLF